MIDKIYDIKNKFIELVDAEIQQRGIDRIDIREMGELVDIIKDLAEAEESCMKAVYYKTVTEAMGKTYASQGYGVGRTDVSNSLHEMLQKAGPAERERLMNEMRTLV